MKIWDEEKCSKCKSIIHTTFCRAYQMSILEMDTTKCKKFKEEEII